MNFLVGARYLTRDQHCVTITHVGTSRMSGKLEAVWEKDKKIITVFTDEIAFETSTGNAISPRKPELDLMSQIVPNPYGGA